MQPRSSYFTHWYVLQSTLARFIIHLVFYASLKRSILMQYEG